MVSVTAPPADLVVAVEVPDHEVVRHYQGVLVAEHEVVVQHRGVQDVAPPTHEWTGLVVEFDNKC